MLFSRREFLFVPAASGLLLSAADQKTRIGLVRSDHGKLARRASPEATLAPKWKTAFAGGTPAAW